MNKEITNKKVQKSFRCKKTVATNYSSVHLSISFVCPSIRLIKKIDQLVFFLRKVVRQTSLIAFIYKRGTNQNQIQNLFFICAPSCQG